MMHEAPEGPKYDSDTSRLAIIYCNGICQYCATRIMDLHTRGYTLPADRYRISGSRNKVTNFA